MECQARNLSHDRVRFYETCFRRCLAVIGDKPQPFVSVHDLRKILVTVKPTSARHYYVAVRRLLKFLVDEDILRREPAQKLVRPKPHSTVVGAISTEDVCKVLASAKKSIHQDSPLNSERRLI